ncbi:hypothetical protein TBLA_0B08750 [Henningerozyma blattae CBS 6284]|uniref:RIC1 C-terminal alpha solenoid region domain-containing protein n=1 Tax=Henningerozyma blattae (strain ATCC 34711 / CBS 6284 / DSM 70876 / NBRC 10599 / NRRL Y-10934 / UCD 77-7) TaxID=1071380 RepID=I2GZY8_HENB6|nr:hypothetical protein TBLA_0B08750 [Tetrapisispora blattae CBS 6284]CCH59690.1 hypothetical protein TBLA_0B08750 [Tetrapisispora blattae CBS 6284]
MQIWPISPPQKLRINDRLSKLSKNSVDGNQLIKAVTIPERNVLCMLTPTRVLVYNFKPLALIDCHERSEASIKEFGTNKSIFVSKGLTNTISGLMETNYNKLYTLHNGKIIFYVLTEKNFLLTYQIIRQSNSIITFKELGVPVVNYQELSFNATEHEYLNTNDEDILTVFDKNKSSRIIQNGYAITKESGFLNFLTPTDDINLSELPIKNLVLRLNVILKFDYDISDIIAFKRLSEEDPEKFEESLILLSENNIQVLNLQKFKLKTSKTLPIKNGLFIHLINNSLIVVSGKLTDGKTYLQISYANLNDQKLRSITLDQTTDNLISTIQFDNSLAIIYENQICYFDIERRQITYSWKPPIEIKICNQLTDNALLIISKNNSIYIFSKFGNQIFTSAIDDDDNDPSLPFNFTDFVYLDKSLILTSTTGDYLFWSFWEQAKVSGLNLRSPQTYIMTNNHNDIAIYSPLGDSSANNDIFQITKLPTRTINNFVSIVRINSNMKLLAACISNKEVLAIQNLETNVWIIFNDLHILDMKWLGSTYLLCHIKDAHDIERLRCYRFPLQGLRAENVEDYLFWEYEIPFALKTCGVHVNTLSKYKLLKLKLKNEETETRIKEKIYKTSEIILITTTEIIVFDVVSVLHLSGLNIIKKIHKYLHLNISALGVNPSTIKMITTYMDSFLFYAGDSFYKLFKKYNRPEDNSTSIEKKKPSIIMKKLMDNIETVIDILKDDIHMIRENNFLVMNINTLWNMEKPEITLSIESNLYPISVSPETATVHSLHCIFNTRFCRMTIKHEIYLDKLIRVKLADEHISASDITNEYRTLKHYNFALEKILSYDIIENQPLEKILHLIKMSDYSNAEDISSVTSTHGNMLKIVSNCLRKIESKYWNRLFYSMDMTPRELLALCIENSEVTILGILLLVFLNYNEADITNNVAKDTINEVPEEDEEDSNTHTRETSAEQEESSRSKRVELQTSSSSASVPSSQTSKESGTESVGNILQDEDLLLKVLHLLVTGAANSKDPTKAASSWDMCFQLIRFLRALDEENKTNLVEKALKVLQ